MHICVRESVVQPNFLHFFIARRLRRSFTCLRTLSEDDAIVCEKSPSRVDVAEQMSEMPQPTRVASSPHSPISEEPRYQRRERHKPA